MSSGRIGMILTYVKNKNNNANNNANNPIPSQLKEINTAINRPIRYARINRDINVSMHNIIHKPASGCSSCGN